MKKLNMRTYGIFKRQENIDKLYNNLYFNTILIRKFAS